MMLFLGLLCILVGMAAGLIDGNLKTPEIYSLHIYSDIKYRFATTKVTSRMKNIENITQEAIFDISLPNEAFITNLTLDIDGKIVVGEIKEKEVARQQYEEARQLGESAGYIGTKQREANKFTLSITVAPQKKVSFNLTYQELLKRKHGHYEQVIYIDAGQPVRDMDITVSIVESRNITKLRVPPLRNDLNNNLINVNTITLISQPTPTTAFVSFAPTIKHQLEQTINGIAGQFVVQYDVTREMDSGEIILVNGYFIHFFAPEGFRPIPNDVLFVLDVSGSMHGNKMTQLKEAMLTILTQMREGDRINIMTFSGSTSFWKSEMVDIIDEDTKEQAKVHVETLQASGWTDIELALTSGIDFLLRRVSSDNAVRSPVIVFLTDGEATVGVTKKEQILENIQAANTENIPIFSLAFGEYADYDLVKKIAIENNGIGRKIYESSDASLQIAGFYNEISVTLLSNLTFKYLDAPVVNLTQHSYKNYFNGSEVVISGRVETVADHEDNRLFRLKISSSSADGRNVVVLSNEMNYNMQGSLENLTQAGVYEEITEKCWAYLTIKQLLDKEMVATDAEEKKNLTNQILVLSLKYGFVTPLTSMVVTRHNESLRMNGVNEDVNKKQPPESKTSRTFILGSVVKDQGSAQKRPSKMYSFNKPLDMNYPQSKMHLFGSAYLLNTQAPLLTLRRHHFQTSSSAREKLSKGKKKSNPNRKTGNRKNEGFQFPLKVQVPNLELPVCFNLYHKEIDAGFGKYTLYEERNSGLSIEVTLKEQIQKNGLKQTGVVEVNVFVNRKQLLSLNRNSFPNFVPPNLDVNGPLKAVSASSNETSTFVSATCDVFNMYVTFSSNEFMSVTIERTAQQIAITAEGLLGAILSQPIQMDSSNPSHLTNKSHTVFNVNGKQIFGHMEPVNPHLSYGSNKCWNFRKNELQVIDVAKFKKGN